MSRIIAYELKEINATDITSVYQNLGSPIENPCIVYTFINTSDTEMYVSFDGINDNLRLPAGGTMVYDTTNVVDHADASVFLLRVNTQIQIKLQNLLATATFGDVYANILTVTSN